MMILMQVTVLRKAIPPDDCSPLLELDPAMGTDRVPFAYFAAAFGAVEADLRAAAEATGRVRVQQAAAVRAEG